MGCGLASKVLVGMHAFLADKMSSNHNSSSIWSVCLPLNLESVVFISLFLYIFQCALLYTKLGILGI